MNAAVVAGVDGWRKGWIVARAHAGALEFVSCATYAMVVEATTDCATVAVDMPIALPVDGVRDAEVALAEYLGRARSSVFYSPCRDALDAPTHAEAVAINKGRGGKGPSIQGWGLRSKIIEVRAALQDGPASHVETHPESAFTMMNEDQPLASKKSARGVAERLDHLRRWFPAIDRELLDAPNRVPVDDVLDACAAAWTAGRVASGTSRFFGPSTRDDEGFGLSISV